MIKTSTLSKAALPASMFAAGWAICFATFSLNTADRQHYSFLTNTPGGSSADFLRDLGTVLNVLLFNVYGAVALAILLTLCGVYFWTQHMQGKPHPAPGVASRDSAAVDQVQAKLSLEITSVLELVRTYVESNNRYAATLAKAQSALGALPRHEEVWTIVKLLISENAKVRADAAELKASLQKSESQIEKLQMSLSHAEQAAYEDPLTTLGNRRQFDSALQKAITQAQDEKSALCLVLADMDNFKSVNDRFGHLAGDEILKLFADLILRKVKDRTKVMRFGGEEFAIVLPRTAMGDAYHLIEQIRAELETSNWVTEKTKQFAGKLTASFGIAQLHDDDSTSNLVQRADAKLYEAKRNGRNCIAIERSVAA